MRVHLRASPRSSWADISPPTTPIELVLPAPATVGALRDAVADRLGTAGGDVPDGRAAVAGTGLPAAVRSRYTKVVLDGVVLADDQALAADSVASGSRGGIALNLVLPARPPPVDVPASGPPSSAGPMACYAEAVAAAAAPRVDELRPGVGLTTGGQRVLIVGANFERGCRCRFGPVRNLSLFYHRYQPSWVHGMGG